MKIFTTGLILGALAVCSIQSQTQVNETQVHLKFLKLESTSPFLMYISSGPEPLDTTDRIAVTPGKAPVPYPAVIYLDQADNKLKMKLLDGSVHNISQ